MGKVDKIALASLLLFLLSLLSGCSCQTYGELRDLGVDCYPNNTCTANSYGYCSCDAKCDLFGECCLDVPDRTLQDQKWRCEEIVFNVGALVRYNCKEGSSRRLRRRCENPVARDMDPIGNVFVNSLKTGVTYNNFYCALCNDDWRELEYWKANMTCYPALYYNDTYGNVSISHVGDNLVYSPRYKLWGVWLWNVTEQFYPCSVRYTIEAREEENYERRFRPCTPEIIAGCPHNWRNATVRKKCASYKSVVSDGKFQYKNVHCAICNGANVPELRCSQELGRGGGGVLPFSALIDFTAQTCSADTSQKCCRQGEVYDGLFKKCRRVFCGRASYGLVFRNGKCEKR